MSVIKKLLIRKKVSSNTQFKQCLINENIPTKDLNAVIFTPFANRVENILTSIMQTDCYIKYLEKLIETTINYTLPNNGYIKLLNAIYKGCTNIKIVNTQIKLCLILIK